MDPLHSVHDVRDPAWLFAVARDAGIAVEKPKGVKLITGLPVHHSSRLPVGVFACRAGIRARDNFARTDLGRFRKENAPDP